MTDFASEQPGIPIAVARAKAARYRGTADMLQRDILAYGPLQEAGMIDPNLQAFLMGRLVTLREVIANEEFDIEQYANPPDDTEVTADVIS